MAQGSSGWSKAPAELVERFTTTMAAYPQAQVRKMFGYPAAFANGYLFTSLFEDRWIVRLPDDALAELAEHGGTEFSPMPGRPMRGYIAIPAAITVDENAMRPWLDRALAHVSSSTAAASEKGPTSTIRKWWKNGECSEVARRSNMEREEPETT